jgi:hypothetical protein
LVSDCLELRGCGWPEVVSLCRAHFTAATRIVGKVLGPELRGITLLLTHRDEKVDSVQRLSQRVICSRPHQVVIRVHVLKH